MSESKFTELVKILDDALAKNGGSKGFCFDGQGDLTKLLKNFERKSLVAVLKQRAMKKGVKAREWSPVAAQVDFMSVAERDVRLRFRNRIQSMNLRTKTAELGRSSMKTMSQEIDKIEKS